MSTAIAYYSATGNTLYAAEHFNADYLVDITRIIEGSACIPDDVERLGIFSPVYCSGLPLPLRIFIREHLGKRDNSSLCYVFAVFTRGAKGRTAERIIERELEEIGINLSYTASVVCPDYYLPLVKGTLSESRTEKLKKGIGEKLAIIKDETDKEKISLPRLSPAYRLVKRISERLTLPKKNGKLTVAPSCTGCTLCSRLCPTGNIVIREGKAERGDNCISCYACYISCPFRSMKYTRDKGYSSLLVEKKKLLKR